MERSREVEILGQGGGRGLGEGCWRGLEGKVVGVEESRNVRSRNTESSPWTLELRNLIEA